MHNFLGRSIRIDRRYGEAIDFVANVQHAVTDDGYILVAFAENSTNALVHELRELR